MFQVDLPNAKDVTVDQVTIHGFLYNFPKKERCKVREVHVTPLRLSLTQLKMSDRGGVVERLRINYKDACTQEDQAWEQEKVIFLVRILLP